MSRSTHGTLILAAVLAAAACTEQPSSLPTQPKTPSSAVVAACDPTLAKQIASEQNALFQAPLAQQARDSFNVIQAQCPSAGASAQQHTLGYVRFTIANFASAVDPNRSSPPTTAEAMVAHWNSVFTYVGLPAPGVAPAALTSAGAAKVCDADADCDVPTNDLKAELYVPVQRAAGFGRHLYTLSPRANGCFGTNLDQTGPCYQVDADPEVAAFDPLVKVGVCQPLRADQPIPGLSPALAHTVLDQATSVTTTRLTTRTATAFPTGCLHVATGDVGARLSKLGALGRLASAALDLVSPRPLYAGHGGLGGTVGRFSPFGGVDGNIFEATFSSPPNVVGSPPAAASDKGTFDVVQVTPPGSITVRASLGDPTRGLLNQPVVLDQAGGACTRCGGLTLRATVTTADASQSATYGTYRVSWASLENKPSPKSAPFVLRGSDGREIARVAYETRSSQRVLTYDGVPLSSRTWAMGVAQRFAILVNLDTKRTSLSIDGTPVPEAQNVAFVAGATNLQRVAAEFFGIDAGIVGWDDVSVVRQPDVTP